MEKRLKNLSQLPKTFNLDKYKDLTTLQAYDWYKQLKIRSIINQKLSRYVQKHEDMDLLINDILKRPIVDKAKSGVMAMYLGDIIDNTPIELEAILNELTAVKPIKHSDINRMQDSNYPFLLRDNYRFSDLIAVKRKNWTSDIKYFEEDGYCLISKHSSRESYWAASYRTLKEQASSPLEDDVFELAFTRTPFSPLEEIGTEMAVSFDLNIPDEVLLMAFKRLLDKQREQFGITKETYRYHPPDFQSWIRFAVLPFLDLTLWASLNNYKIPNRVMADAIFPIGEGGEETVRKTTQKLASTLMDENKPYNKLRELAAYAAFDHE